MSTQHVGAEKVNQLWQKVTEILRSDASEDTLLEVSSNFTSTAWASSSVPLPTKDSNHEGIPPNSLRGPHIGTVPFFVSIT